MTDATVTSGSLPQPPPQQQSPQPKPLVQNAPVTETPVETGQIKGTIVAVSSSAGEIRISTPQGNIVVQTTLPLPPGAEVTVEIYPDANGQPRADISIAKPPPRTTEQLPPLPLPVQEVPPPLLKAGDVVKALLLPDEAPALPSQPLPPAQVEKIVAQIAALPKNAPLPPVLEKIAAATDIRSAFIKLPAQEQQKIVGFFNPPTPTALPAGEETIFGILRPHLPAKAPLASPFPAVLGKILPLIEKIVPSTPKILPQAVFQGKGAAPALPQNLFELKVVKILPPATPAPSIPPQQQKGVVESATPAGFPVIRTDKGLFVLKTQSPAPVGSVVIFETKPVTPEHVAAPQSFNPLTSETWPALEEALENLMASTPMATQALRNTIPAPATPAKFTPAVLFFMAALRPGTLESWLGENTLQILRQSGKKDLIEKLAGDLSRISAQSKTPLAGEWRSISLPTLHDDHISQMQLYIRRQGDGEESGGNDDRKPVTRFILNLNLSRLGDLQLDGLLRNKRLDLILRTREKLSLSMRQELSQKFAAGLGQAGLQGGIGFQMKREGWVSVATAETQAGIVA